MLIFGNITIKIKMLVIVTLYYFKFIINIKYIYFDVDI